MLNLIRLENKKFNLGGFIFGAIIASICILGIMSFLPIIAKIQGDHFLKSYALLFKLIATCSKAVFTVFAAVLISKTIIEEYKSKTISVLFSYPINRKKLMLSKLTIIVIFTFLAIVFSNIFITSAMCVIDNFYKLMPDTITVSLLASNLLNVIIEAIPSSLIALIPLYFGMKSKSVPATITTSFIAIVLLCSHAGANDNSLGFSLGDIIIVPIILSLIGIFIAYLSIKNIENKDLIN